MRFEVFDTDHRFSLKKILWGSAIIFLSLILIIVLVVWSLDYAKPNSICFVPVAIVSPPIIAVLFALVRLIKDKEWSSFICLGYIIILLSLIFWIIYKNVILQFSLLDHGICFLFFLFSVYIFELIKKFFFWVKVINQPTARVNEAIIKGLNKLGLSIIVEPLYSWVNAGVDQIVVAAYDPKLYEYRGRGGSDPLKIVISIKELAQNSTEIRIRVGYLGNMKCSRQIFEAIESYL